MVQVVVEAEKPVGEASPDEVIDPFDIEMALAILLALATSAVKVVPLTGNVQPARFSAAPKV